MKFIYYNYFLSDLIICVYDCVQWPSRKHCSDNNNRSLTVCHWNHFVGFFLTVVFVEQKNIDTNGSDLHYNDMEWVRLWKWTTFVKNCARLIRCKFLESARWPTGQLHADIGYSFSFHLFASSTNSSFNCTNSISLLFVTAVNMHN